MVGEIGNDYWNPGIEFPTTLGVFAHEIGHLTFGLPDLYDVNNDINGQSAGVGYYGLMGSGNHGLDPARDDFPGETPVLPTAWSQFKLNWVGATSNFPFGGLTTSARSATLVGDVKVGIAHPGERDNLTGIFRCYADQYFLMQYRTAEGYDRGLNAVIDPWTSTEYDGVVIYHVDERQPNNNVPAAMLLDVEEAATPGLSEVPWGAPHHLWGNDGNTHFYRWSTPNSNVGNSLAFSGVSIEIGARHNGSKFTGPIRSIDVSIDSPCDAKAF